MLERIAGVLIRRGKTILILFVALTLLSVVLMLGVNVNFDLTAYLPAGMDTTIAMERMEESFGLGGSARIMLPETTVPEALAMKAKIAAVDGVSAVVWLDDMADVSQPLEAIDRELVEAYYKDGAALFTVTFPESDYSDSTRQAVRRIRDIVGEDAVMAGSAVSTGLMIESSSDEVLLVVLWAIPFALLILLFTTSSYIEAVLFLVVLLMSVAINMGTNIFMGSVSFFTQLSVAVLQMAISMDYCIFLLNRYSEERSSGLEKEAAMRKAVSRMVSAIVASALTTVAGFVALMFMRYTIGLDMGFVLAKGIAISLLSVMLVMPGLVVMLDGVIRKTTHRKLRLPFRPIGRLAVNSKGAIVIVWLLLLVPAYLGQSNNAFVYGESSVMASEGSDLNADRERIEAVYGVDNPIVLIAPDESTAAEAIVCEELLAIDGVTSVQSFASLLPKGYPDEMLPSMYAANFRQDGLTRYILNLDAADESPRALHTVVGLRAYVSGRWPDGDASLLGTSASVTDIREVVETDYTWVSWISIGLVALILMIAFRSVKLPIVLILAIESAIWMNMSIPYFTGVQLSFIGYMIVSAIQLGATIDYAILLTDRYREQRLLYSKKESAIRAVELAGGSIITSGGVLTACGFVVGAVTSISGISQLGVLIGRGAALSMGAVLLVLPMLLVLTDFRKDTDTVLSKGALPHA